MKIIEFNSGINISGENFQIKSSNEMEAIYVQFQGPTELSFENKTIAGQTKLEHSKGYGTPVGFWKKQPQYCPSKLTIEDLKKLGLETNKKTKIDFLSGVLVEGVLTEIYRQQDRLLIMTFEACTVSFENQILFRPEWGKYDMAIGSKILNNDFE